MNECVNLENVGRVEELLAMTEQMQDELDQKDQTILELNNTANLFPSIAGESMTNVYRISVTLTDEIDSEKLQEPF